MAKPSPNQYRRDELAKIHIAKKDLGLPEEIYRDMVRAASNGKTESSGKLTWQGRRELLERFKEKGWQPKPAKASGAATVRQLADDPQSKKIRALWLELHQVGLVRDPSEKALASYVKRMTNVAALQWLDGPQASLVIEALKKWLARDV